MNIQRIIIASIFCGIAAYAILTWLTLDLNPDSPPCTNRTLLKLAPWSSGCFYSAYFNEKTVEPEQLDFENKMLNRFTENHGLATTVLWYRSKLHQKYQLHFKTNFQQLHEMHTDYTRAEHTKLVNQVEYWHFLHVNELTPLAQQSLNDFCNIYIPNKRADAVEEIKWRIAQRSLPLALDSCEAKTGRE